MKQRLFSHLRGRARLLGWVAAIALLTSLGRPAPADKSLFGLLNMLERASGQTIDAEQLAWEPSAGAPFDLVFGRGIFFLASATPGAPRDVFHAFVRVSPQGRPLGVTRVHNITETPLGDDTGLVSYEGHVAFATIAFGRIQAVTVLDVAGIGADDLPEGVIDRGLLKINSLQELGSLRGFGRTDILFDVPPKQLDLQLDTKELALDFEEKKRDLRFDLATRTLRGKQYDEPYAARAVPQKHGHKPFVIWAVDTVRYEVGPEPIAWLEDKVFGAFDTFRRTTYSLFSAEQKIRRSEPVPDTAAVPSEPAPVPSWPPPAIASIWSAPKSDEGQWQPVLLPWLASLPGVSGKETPPPYFYRTVIRPDAERPYVEVSLIAFDMRQLELRMVPGYEDPKPLTGPPGDGYIPRDPKVLSRVVATFNGAFKTTHGAYGMMVDRRVLVPPVRKAASIVIDDSGDMGFGTWPSSLEIPRNLASFRQNLDPLVESGIANPTGRSKWGAELGSGGVLTERTAICLTPAHQIYYAWGRELSGLTLSQALQQAGCEYAVHLDMNPKHCGFVFNNVRDIEQEEVSYELANREMDINPLRYVLRSPKDFFYVLVRDPRPSAKVGETWIPSTGEQPEPSWLSGMFVTKTRLGGIEVELLSIDRDRVDWRVRAGRRELGSEDKDPAKRGLPPLEYNRALLALSLGHATNPRQYGLVVAGKVVMPLRKSYATLILPASGSPRIYAAGAEPAIAAREEAVQLPLLAQNRQLTPAAHEPGSVTLRGALCVLPNGSLLVARASHDSNDAITEALVERGCDLVVALDRGSHHPVLAHQRGTETPPLPLYDTTSLYALNRAFEPRAFHWQPESPPSP